MKLSILIPVYNERETILPILKIIKDVCVDKEIIIVDDCSSDGTRELLLKNFGNGRENLKIIYQDVNQGKGSAIKAALAQAKGEYAIIQDADMEYDPNDYILLMEAITKNNTDVVYGSRFKKTWKNTSWWHFLGNIFLTAVTNILYGSRLTDMETCYKLIRADIFRDLNIQSKRFEIEPEITAKLIKKGYKIIEVPISYRGRGYHEGKKIGWKDGFATIATLFKYKFKQ
ncbi:MAG: glycosyltransferase family 2 protein [Candidatus Omnitrophota bacterium]